MIDRVSSDSLSHCHSPRQARLKCRQAIATAIKMADLTDVELLLQPFLDQLDKNDNTNIEDLKKADATKKEAARFNELTCKAMLCLHAYQRKLVLRAVPTENLKRAFEEAAPVLALKDVNSLEKCVTFWRDAELLMKPLNAAYAQLTGLMGGGHVESNHLVGHLLKLPYTELFKEIMKIINEENLIKYFTESEQKIVNSTLAQLRQGAVRDAIKALKSSLALCNKTGRGFQLHTRNGHNFSFEVNPQLLDSSSKFRNMLEPMWEATNDYAKQRYTKKRQRRQLAYFTLPDLGQVSYPVRIFKRPDVCKAKQRYYIAVPTPIRQQRPTSTPPPLQRPLPTVTAIDPGVCTPCTTFDPTGKSIKYAPHQPLDKCTRRSRNRPPATTTARQAPWESPNNTAASAVVPTQLPAPAATTTTTTTRPRNGQIIAVMLHRWHKLQARLRKWTKMDKEFREETHKEHHRHDSKDPKKDCEVCKKRRKSYHTMHNMRRAAERLMRRMRSLVTELHHRVAHDLCSNYNLILLPEYKASQMVCRRNRLTGEARKISAGTVRGLLAWRPYQFKQFLLHKAREFSNCTVVIVDEVCLWCFSPLLLHYY